MLPFVNLSNDPEQEYFSDGITEDIINSLSRLASLFVISRTSAFTYKSKAIKVQDISKEMGVQYVLEGSVRRADNQVRVMAQLIDAIADRHLWSERYDRPLTDIFAVQDESVQKIAITLRLQLTLWDQGVMVWKHTDNPEAYDYFLRGLQSFWRFAKDANLQARQMFESAVALDPRYAMAYALMGSTYWLEWFYQWSKDTQGLEQALALGQKAIGLDDSLSAAYQALGQFYLFKRQHDQAIAEEERAIALDPNFATAYAQLGLILIYAGQPQEAIEWVQKALRLNPQVPVSYLAYLGFALHFAGRDEEAIPILQKARACNPDYMDPHVQLAVIYSELGRMKEAQAEVAEILRLSPDVTVEGARQKIPFKDSKTLERFLAALRRAGLE